MKCLFLLVALVCLLNRGTRSFIEHGVVVGGANCAASDIGFPCNLLGDCALVLRFKHALVGFLVCSLYSLFPILVTSVRMWGPDSSGSCCPRCICGHPATGSANLHCAVHRNSTTQHHYYESCWNPFEYHVSMSIYKVARGSCCNLVGTKSQNRSRNYLRFLGGIVTICLWNSMKQECFWKGTIKQSRTEFHGSNLLIHSQMLWFYSSHTSDYPLLC